MQGIRRYSRVGSISSCSVVRTKGNDLQFDWISISLYPLFTIPFFRTVKNLHCEAAVFLEGMKEIECQLCLLTDQVKRIELDCSDLERSVIDNQALMIKNIQVLQGGAEGWYIYTPYGVNQCILIMYVYIGLKPMHYLICKNAAWWVWKSNCMQWW